MLTWHNPQSPKIASPALLRGDHASEVSSWKDRHKIRDNTKDLFSKR